MQKFKIEVRETLSRTVEVEAKNEAEAIGKVEDLYHSQEIVLSAEDFDGDTEFFNQTESAEAEELLS